MVISVQTLDEVTPRRLLSTIHNRGERVVKESALFGRKALIAVGDNVTAVYIPDRGAHVRLGYSATSGESFNEFMGAYLEFLKSFRFNIPCECTDERRSAGIEFGNLRRIPSLKVVNASEDIPFGNFISSEKRGKVTPKANAVVYPHRDSCLLVVVISDSVMRRKEKFIEIHYLSRGQRLLSTEVKLISAGGSKGWDGRMTSIDLNRKSIGFTESTPGDARLSPQKIEPWVGALADNRGFLDADFGGDLGKIRLGYDVTGAEMR